MGQVWDAIADAGVDKPQYCGHIFCISAAMTAAVRGIQDSTMKTLGRWESMAYLQCVRIPQQQLTG